MKYLFIVLLIFAGVGTASACGDPEIFCGDTIMINEGFSELYLDHKFGDLAIIAEDCWVTVELEESSITIGRSYGFLSLYQLTERCYRIMFHCDNCNSSTAIIYCHEFPLPVELIDFWAEESDVGVILCWRTGRETEGIHFEIRRDGIRIDEISGGRGIYSYHDRWVRSGEHLYELICVEHDGRREVIGGRVWSVEHSTSWFSELIEIECYPNPFNEGSMISLTVKQDAVLEIRIIDLMGRETKHWKKKWFATGKHTIPFSLQHCAIGMYFVQVIENGALAVQINIVYLK